MLTQDACVYLPTLANLIQKGINDYTTLPKSMAAAQPKTTAACPSLAIARTRKNPRNRGVVIHTKPWSRHTSI
jgi:hypothetical protein